MTPRADAIADLVCSTFRSLPSKFKPRSVDRREWVPIAGIVLSRDTEAKHNEETWTESAECVALATGMKCHPHSKIPHLHGYGLHDSHAEILALRAFNCFLLQECADLAAKGLGNETKWLRWQRDSQRFADRALSSQQPFRLHDDVAIHLYCSEAPCGDASMELTMAKQDDATPWSSPNKYTATVEEANGALMHGRAHFDLLGAVRRKPSRPDAPVSLSKSCTDKLALKQCTGVLSSLTAQLIWPGSVYIHDFTVPVTEYVAESWERAFGSRGRMAKLQAQALQRQWSGSGFSFKPFEVLTTEREFEFSKRFLSRELDGALEPAPSNKACVFISPSHTEALINGVLEGRKWDESRGASELSRRKMWQAAASVARTVGVSSLTERRTYKDLKGSDVLKGRREVKNQVIDLALQGWQRNEGDDEWSLSEGEWAVVESIGEASGGS